MAIKYGAGVMSRTAICVISTFTSELREPLSKSGVKSGDIDLTQDLFGKGYHLYFHNFFNSVELAEELLTHHIGIIATTQVKRPCFRREWRKVSQECGHVKSVKVGHIECYAWQDKKQANFLNIITDQHQKTTCMQSRGRRRTEAV